MRRVLVLTLFVLLVAGAPEALADGLSFTAPQQLPHGDPTKPDYLSGGEPSLAFDPNGDGHVYVTAPQFIPTGANNACNQLGPPLGIPSLCSPTNSPTGIGYWASDDGGRSWPRSGNTGTANGGGDSDVAVLPDHTVLAADLEAADAAVCLSHDFAKTFDNCNSGITSDHTGPENDREWLTVAGKTVYLSYHDFTAGIPIIERSDDGGKSWQPCGNIIDPSVATTYTPQGGTLVAKPVVGKDGTVYVEFITPDSAAPPVGATLDNVYMAVSPKGGCQGGVQFKNYKVFSNSSADLGKIFLADAIDGGGQLYILAGGKTDKAQPNTNLWLFTSTDGGQHWSQPIPANPPELTANVFPWVDGGPAKGQLAIGWFGTNSNPDPNNLTSQWRYYGGASLDGGRSFAYTTITPDVIHYGDICTQGIFCGLVPPGQGNRNLADFASVAVDPKSGCTAAAFPGDPYNRPDVDNGPNNFSSSTYYARQQDNAACFSASNAGAAAGTIASTGSPAGAPRISTCADHIPPVSRVTGRRISRTRAVRLSGRSRDRGCGAKGAGRVRRVRVAVGRRYADQRCRYLKPNNRFGPLVSCLRTTYLSARGTTRWSIRLKRRLPRGRYVVWARGIDAAGNVEHKARRVNLGRFTVR
jgi:hypothetical protein